MNGDGKADYVYVESGAIYVWINQGPSGSGGSYIWKSLGKVNVNDVGATPENVQMVDIDGKPTDSSVLQAGDESYLLTLS